jgi:hypothetical protein
MKKRKSVPMSTRPETRILFGFGIVAIVAAFDTTTPTHTRFDIDTMSTVQPAIMDRTLLRIYAGLFDGVRVARHSHKHVVSIG